MTRYDTLSHTGLSFYFSTRIFLRRPFQILRDANNISWKHKEFPWIHNDDGYPGSCRKFLSEIIKMTRSWTFNFLSLISYITKSIFVHNTTRESCTKVTILGCGWCQTISSKSKCQYECFYCAFQILHNPFQHIGIMILASTSLVAASSTPATHTPPTHPPIIWSPAVSYDRRGKGAILI